MDAGRAARFHTDADWPAFRLRRPWAPQAIRSDLLAVNLLNPLLAPFPWDRTRLHPKPQPSRWSSQGGEP
jgi:hypothetical protein